MRTCIDSFMCTILFASNASQLSAESTRRPAVIYMGCDRRLLTCSEALRWSPPRRLIQAPGRTMSLTFAKLLTSSSDLKIRETPSFSLGPWLSHEIRLKHFGQERHARCCAPISALVARCLREPPLLARPLLGALGREYAQCGSSRGLGRTQPQEHCAKCLKGLSACERGVQHRSPSSCLPSSFFPSMFIAHANAGFLRWFF